MQDDPDVELMRAAYMHQYYYMERLASEFDKPLSIVHHRITQLAARLANGEFQDMDNNTRRVYGRTVLRAPATMLEAAQTMGVPPVTKTDFVAVWAAFNGFMFIMGEEENQ